MASMLRLTTMTMTMFTALAIGACSGNRDETITEQCDRVREHLIRIELPLADAKREDHARVMRRAMGGAFLDHCARSMTAAQRKCALDAADSRGAMACTSKARKQVVAKEETK